jgi:hypothetical protein
MDRFLGCGAKIIAMIKLIGLIYGMEQLIWKRIWIYLNGSNDEAAIILLTVRMVFEI